MDPSIIVTIGWMGFTGYIASIFGCFLAGFYLDRFKTYKFMALLLNVTALLLWLIITVAIQQGCHINSILILFGMYSFFGIPYFACGIEQAAEMTSPVPEETSSTFILLLGNFCGFIVMYSLGQIIESGYQSAVLYVVLALRLLSTVFVGVAKV